MNFYFLPVRVVLVRAPIDRKAPGFEPILVKEPLKIVSLITLVVMVGSRFEGAIKVVIVLEATARKGGGKCKRFTRCEGRLI
jgi:hypothetical protein